MGNMLKEMRPYLTRGCLSTARSDVAYTAPTGVGPVRLPTRRILAAHHGRSAVAHGIVELLKWGRFTMFGTGVRVAELGLARSTRPLQHRCDVASNRSRNHTYAVAQRARSVSPWRSGVHTLLRFFNEFKSNSLIRLQFRRKRMGSQGGRTASTWRHGAPVEHVSGLPTGVRLTDIMWTATPRHTQLQASRHCRRRFSRRRHFDKGARAPYFAAASWRHYLTMPPAFLTWRHGVHRTVMIEDFARVAVASHRQRDRSLQ